MPMMPRRTQQGVGIVEILVAVVIISIGFLAAASMQVQGMRFSQSAYFRSQAYFMASEIIDRMRTNPQALFDRAYVDGATSATAENPECDLNDCDSTQMVEQDLFDWSSSLHNVYGIINFTPVLPSSASIEARGLIQSVGNNEYRVSVFWAETINGDDAEQSLVINFATESSN